MLFLKKSIDRLFFRIFPPVPPTSTLLARDPTVRTVQNIMIPFSTVLTCERNATLFEVATLLSRTQSPYVVVLESSDARVAHRRRDNRRSRGVDIPVVLGLVKRSDVMEAVFLQRRDQHGTQMKHMLMHQDSENPLVTAYVREDTPLDRYLHAAVDHEIDVSIVVRRPSKRRRIEHAEEEEDLGVELEEGSSGLLTGSSGEEEYYGILKSSRRKVVGVITTKELLRELSLSEAEFPFSQDQLDRIRKHYS